MLIGTHARVASSSDPRLIGRAVVVTGCTDAIGTSEQFPGRHLGSNKLLFRPVIGYTIGPGETVTPDLEPGPTLEGTAEMLVVEPWPWDRPSVVG